MILQKQTLDPKSDLDLSKALLGLFRMVGNDEIDPKTAATMVNIADKYTKNELMRMQKAEMLQRINEVEYLTEKDKLLTQS